MLMGWFGVGMFFLGLPHNIEILHLFIFHSDAPRSKGYHWHEIQKRP